MPIISKIKLPNDSQTYDLTDGRGMFVGACSSSAASQTKEVSVSVDQNFVLRAGAVVAVKFANTNTYNATASAPCKININGTGAKNIYYAGSATPTGTNTTAFGTANYYHYYIYDGTYWVWNGYSSEANTIPVKTSSAISDLNEAYEVGLYFYQNTALNKPTSSGGVVLTLQNQTNGRAYSKQIAFVNSNAFSATNFPIYARESNSSGVFSDWVQFSPLISALTSV